MNIKKLLLFCGFAVVLASCSSDDGGGSSDPTPVPANSIVVGGQLVDPGISGARLAIVDDNGTVLQACGAGVVNQLCEVFGDDNGYFSFIVKADTDLTNYHVKSFGGTDSVLNTNFFGVSFSTPLEAFTGVDNGTNIVYDVVVSPVSTLLSEMLAAGMPIFAIPVAVAPMIGIDYDNLTANPLESESTLKVSYLLADMMTEGGVQLSTIIDKIRPFSTDETDPALYKRDFLMAVYDNDTAQVDRTLAIVNSYVSVDFSNLNDAVLEIASVEKQYLFDIVARGTMTSYPADNITSDAYKANVESLLSRIETLTGKTIIPNEATVLAVFEHLLLSDSTYGDYATYGDIATFNTKIATITSSSDIIANIDTILTGINSVSIPLATPLANNSGVLSDYYFSSDISNTNLALSLIERTTNDALRDDIYERAIEAYATYGFYETAESYANAFIRDPVNRADAYLLIASAISEYGTVELATSYVNLASDILKQLIQESAGSSTLSTYIEEYATVVGEYYRIGNNVAGDAAYAYTNTIVDALDETTTPSKYTVIGRLVSAYYNDVVEPFIEAGEYQTAYALIPVQLDLAIDEYTNSTSSSKANLAYIRFGDISENLVNIGVGDATIRESAQFADYVEKTRVEYLKISPISRFTISNFSGIASAVLIADGRDAAIQVIADNISTINADELEDPFNPGVNDSRVDNATRDDDIFGMYADMSLYIGILEGNTAAFNWFEQYLPIDPTSSTADNIIEDYMELLVYFNEFNPSLAYTHLRNGENSLAIEVLDYMVGVLDMYTTDVYGDNATNPVVFGMEDVSPSSRYSLISTTNYTRIAHFYIEAEDNAKALASLNKALAYTDNAADSFHKSYSYGILGYYYQLLGEDTIANATFDKAVAMNFEVAPFTNDNDTLSYIYTGIARDYILRGDKANAISNLETALTKADSFAKTIGDDKAGDPYRNIANTYVEAGELETAVELLISIPSKVANVGISGEDIATIYTDDIIIPLSNYGLVDEAYTQAETLFADDLPNRYDAISEIAQYVSDRDAFPESNIAFSDTDGDGMPDFFLPFATEAEITASGLTLDDDIDGDGVLNEADYTPFFANPVN